MSRQRRLILLPPVDGIDPLDVVFAGLPAGEGLRFGPSAAGLRALCDALGLSASAVALDLSAGLDLDALGRAEGLVRGGGALYLRLPSPGQGDLSLAVPPYGPEAAADRALERLLRVIAPAAERPAALGSARVAPAPPLGSPEQDAAVAALVAAIGAGGPARIALMADRGRGKSAAIGRALAAGAHGRVGAPAPSVLLTGPSPASVAEVCRFAGPDAPRYTAPLAAIEAAPAAVLVVEEAAQIGVPMLRALAVRHAAALQIYATTVFGYEGSGRGFSLRFWPELVAAAAAGGPRAGALRLSAPIRWAAGDPLEAALRDGLLLDAAPVSDARAAHASPVACRARWVPQAELAADDGLLRDVFGLLVAAHYRSTPADLRRLLDAPNLDLHALFFHGAVVGVCLVAREGGLSAERCAEVAAGRGRIRGQALPDTLGSHLGEPEAGALRMARSVRLAVHPAARGRGLAAALVAHVHAHYDVDLFGTLFGATPALLRLRARLGYRLCRVSSAVGGASGEPSALMLRPVSAEAEALVARLGQRLRRELPTQLCLLEADGGLPLGPLRPALLREAGLEDGVAHVDHSEESSIEALASALAGPCPMDALPTAVAAALRRRPLGDGPAARTLAARYLDLSGWAAAAAAGGFPTVKAAQRAARRALRAALSAASGG